MTIMRMNNMAKAYEIAAVAHAGQVRKGNGEPYINHPIRVAHMVSTAGIGSRHEIVDLIIAAILHDTVEDSDLTLEEIGTTFGTKVRDLVDGCTDTPGMKKLPRPKRKAAQAKKVRELDQGVQLIKLADQVDNLESLFRTLESFETGDATSRVEGMLLVVKVCESANRVLLHRAEKAGQNIRDALLERNVDLFAKTDFQDDRQVCPHSGESADTDEESAYPEI